MIMLEIKKLNVSIKEKKILKDFSLNIKDGEIHAIMGPNGVGKSTLSKVIMGDKNYKVDSGSIVFNDKDITDLAVDERARLGIFMAMQNPISIEGVKNSEFLKTALSVTQDRNVSIFEFIKTMDKSMQELEMDPKMLHRSINKGFSGGERKKNEILQMKILKPSFIILDELDSGLDVDSLKIVCDNINDYLKENPKTSVLIITHYSRILQYIKPEFVHAFLDGKIAKTSNLDFAYEIEKNGYIGLNEMKENA
ncbi:MAG: Fe-S cluster assembly ATPase SufC [Bacilli bacterium]